MNLAKIFAVVLLFSQLSNAVIKTETVQYKEGSTELEGYVVYDDALRGGPGVVIVHDWMGISDDTKTKAAELATLGYVAFVADIYGKGVHPADQKAAGELAGKYKGDRQLLRKRALAAYETLKKNPRVNKNKIAAQGYCFGGTTVLEMALSGAHLQAVTSIHGGLEFPDLQKDVKKIKGKLLVLHGAIDPYVPAEQVNAFTKALDGAKTDYQFVAYSGSVHSFTNPKAGNDISKGAAYNPVAEKRAFEATKTFYAEVLN